VLPSEKHCTTLQETAIEACARVLRSCAGGGLIKRKIKDRLVSAANDINSFM
jgi:hypothetical protein